MLLILHICAFLFMCLSSSFPGTVCDQGKPNVAAINHLIDTSKKHRTQEELQRGITTFIVDGQEIIPLYDPPHLLKGMRNNLLNKELHFTVEINNERVHMVAR